MVTILYIYVYIQYITMNRLSDYLKGLLPEEVCIYARQYTKDIWECEKYNPCVNQLIYGGMKYCKIEVKRGKTGDHDND